MSTDAMPLDEGHKPRRKVVFDPTINLGHVLTFIGFVSAGFAAYQTLDRRLSVQETRHEMLQERMREKDGSLNETLREVRNDIKDLRNDIRISGQQPPPQPQQRPKDTR